MVSVIFAKLLRNDAEVVFEIFIKWLVVDNFFNIPNLTCEGRVELITLNSTVSYAWILSNTKVLYKVMNQTGNFRNSALRN